MEKSRALTQANNSFIINREELEKIDLWVAEINDIITENLDSKELTQELIDNCRALEEFYNDLMEDCGLVELEEE